MEALIFIALVIIIILLFNIKSSQKEIATRTHQSFLSLKKELTEIKNAATQQPTKEKPVSSKDENVVQWRPVIPSEAIKPPIEPFPQQPVEASQKLEVPNDLRKENIPSSEPPIPETITQVAAPAPTIEQESWQEKWLRNNPDLEKFIGENLINKIGITVLVLGIAFFVKYAIDQNWIKEVGRVSIGIGCGMLLIGLGHYLRNSYRSFSSVLAGGGLAVLYFTIAFAFHQYQLFSQTAAFIIMVVITAFAVALSLLYNRQELAIIASIGGFITPFLVSTGEGNYVVLFTYLIILNLGMLALSWFKNWQSIHVISLFFTIIIYGGWLGRSTYTLDEFPFYKNAFLFATIFYGLFLSMNLINNLRMQRPFKAFDFSLILLINFSYYTAGMINLSYWNNGAYHGLFTICLAAINLLLSGYLYLNKKGDRNLLYLLVGLTVTFVSLFIPVQLNGHSITLSWSAEFVLLYWLHQRSGMKIFKASSFVIMMLALISLFIDWGKANFTSHNELIVVYKNLQGFVTNIVAVIAFTLYAILLRKDIGGIYLAGIRNNVAATVMIVVASVLLYLTTIFGVNLYFFNAPNTDLSNSWHQLITYLFAGLLLFIIKKYKLSVPVVLQFLFITACVGMYLFSIPAVTRLRDGVLANQYPGIQLLVHAFAALVLLYLLYTAIAIYRQRNHKIPRNFFTWVISLLLLIFFSVECMHVYVLTTSGFQSLESSLQQYNKAGLTIVWALCSFAIMWIGMRLKFKTLRIISLVIFTLALLKLFLFDIRKISEGGKIAAFIMLGILLLIISFMYQKLKKIIIDDATN